MDLRPATSVLFEKPITVPATQTLASAPTSVSSDAGTQEAPQIAPAIPERRRIILEFPPKIRAGDSDVIRLSLEMDRLGNLTPTAEVAGNKVTGGTVEIPNLYETHHVTAEARLDMAGADEFSAVCESLPRRRPESLAVE